MITIDISKDMTVFSNPGNITEIIKKIVKHCQCRKSGPEAVVRMLAGVITDIEPFVDLVRDNVQEYSLIHNGPAVSEFTIENYGIFSSLTGVVVRKGFKTPQEAKDYILDSAPPGADGIFRVIGIMN